MLSAMLVKRLSTKRMSRRLTMTLILHTIVAHAGVESIGNFSLHLSSIMSVDSPCMSNMSVRLVECVRMCLRHENCRSLTFHRNTRDCRLFGVSLQRSVTKVSTSDLKYGTIKPEKVEVVLADDKLSWTKANKSCSSRGGQLYKINSAEKQAIAAALVKEKDYHYVYIGVHWHKWIYDWTYVDEEILTYSNWDNDEKYSFALYVVMDAAKDYKWTPVTGTPYPYLCEVIS